MKYMCSDTYRYSQTDQHKMNHHRYLQTQMNRIKAVCVIHVLVGVNSLREGGLGAPSDRKPQR